MYSSRGFTLLELLIVIAILAILAAATILVLNPAELLRQSRDAKRVSDLFALNKALGLYITSANTITLDSNSLCTTRGYSHNGTTTAAGQGLMSTSTAKLLASTTNRTTSGSGWLPVNFSSIPGGSPLGTLPVDPSNTANYRYEYLCDSTASTYELDTRLESEKYLTNDDLDAKDGGNNLGVYEVGTAPGLSL